MNLGSYSKISEVWVKFPEGGNEGDSVLVGNITFTWDKYLQNWVSGSVVTAGYDAGSVSGDLHVSRHQVIGGDETVRGSSVVKRDLKVEGTLYARIKGADKGLFPSVDRLKSNYPKAVEGDYAVIGEKIPGPIYRYDGKNWVDTGEVGGNGGAIDLADYYNKEVVDVRTKGLDNRIAVIEKVAIGGMTDYSGEELTEPLIVDYRNGLTNSGTSTLAATANHLFCESATYVEVSVPVNVTAIFGGIAFYDRSGKYIIGFPRPVGTLGRRIEKYFVPANAYSFRTTYYDAKNRIIYGDFYCVVHFDGKKLSDEVVEFGSEILIDNYNVDSASGYVNNSSVYSATGYISCKGAYELELMMPIGMTATTTGIAFWDEKLNYVRGVERGVSSKNGVAKRVLPLMGQESFFKTCFWDSNNRKEYGEFYCKVKYRL